MEFVHFDTEAGIVLVDSEALGVVAVPGYVALAPEFVAVVAPA